MNGKVLITGGLGNLGSWLTAEFCKSSFEVYVLTRKEKYKIEGLNYKVIEADICDIDSLRQKLNIKFDFCIHTASFNEFFVEDYPAKALQINTLGTRNLLEVLNANGIKKFIYFSTFHVYGVSAGIVNEDTELIPKNDYALTHLFAEYYVKQFNLVYGLEYTIFRLTNSYGAPMYINSDKWYLVLNDLVKTAFEKEKISLNSNGKAKRDFIWMGDVAKITLDTILKKTNSIYNLSSMSSLEVIEIAKLVQQEYKNRYTKEIAISTNSNDLNKYDELIVDNNRLKCLHTELKLNNRFVDEINNIFDLLEGAK